MYDQQIAERIRKHIITNFFFEDASSMVPDDTSLLREGVVDSTGVLDMILFVEEEFGIEVADEDVTPDNFDSVACLTAYVAGALDRTPSPV